MIRQLALLLLIASVSFSASVTGCMNITSPDSYVLSNALSGANVSASDVLSGSLACIKISSSDVALNCNGYQIANGTGTTTIGIAVGGGLTDVNITNCPLIANYSYGVYALSTNTSVFSNINVANFTFAGFYASNVNATTFANDTVSNATGQNATGAAIYGFELISSQFNSFNNDTMWNITGGNGAAGVNGPGGYVYGFYGSNSGGNSFTNNTIANNTGGSGGNGTQVFTGSGGNITAIYLISSQNCNITGNAIVNNTPGRTGLNYSSLYSFNGSFLGMYLSASGGAIIQGNNLTHDVIPQLAYYVPISMGMDIELSPNTVIDNNTFFNVTTHGIWANLTNNLSITRNYFNYVLTPMNVTNGTNMSVLSNIMWNVYTFYSGGTYASYGLEATGWNQSVFYNNTMNNSVDGFIFYNPNSILIANNTANNTQYNFYVSTGFNTSIINNSATTCSADCFVATGSNYSLMANNYVYNINGAGTDYYLNSPNSVFANNTGVGSNSYGLDLESSYNVSLWNNSMSQDSGAGYYIYYSTNISAINNSALGYEWSAFKLMNATWSNFTNNSVKYCSGFYMDGNSAFDNFSYNNISNIQWGATLTTTIYGFYLSGTQNSTFMSNTVFGTNTTSEPVAGIYITANAFNNTFTNTYISNMSVAGIVVSGNQKPNLFINTTINNSGNSSIVLNFPQYLWPPSSYGYLAGGLILIDSSNITFINGSILNSEFFGTFFERSYNNTLYNVDIENSTDYDLFVDPAGSNLSQCNDNISQITSSGGRYINYSNSSVSWSNLNVAEIFLCDAPNSNLTNITVQGGAQQNNNGLVVVLSNGTTIINSNSSGNYDGFYADRSSNSVIANNTATSNGNFTSQYFYPKPAGILVDTFSYQGLSLGPSANVTVSGNNVTNTTGIGILLNASVANVSSNTIANVSSANGDDSGIYLYNLSNSTILNNSIVNITYGITVYYVFNSSIANNTLRFALSGIGVVSSNLTNVSGNLLQNFTYSGVILAASQNGIVENNVIQNVSGSTVQGAGIDISTNGYYSNVFSKNNTIRNNTLYNDSNGIYVLYEGYLNPGTLVNGNLTIVNNTAYGNTNSGYIQRVSLGGRTNYANYIANTTYINNVAFNDSRSGSYAGFYLYNILSSTIANNIAYSNCIGYCNSGGFQIGAENSTIANNTAYNNSGMEGSYDNGAYGIYVYSYDNGTDLVWNNSAFNNTLGIVVSSPNMSIINNTATGNDRGFVIGTTASNFTSNNATSNLIGIKTGAATTNFSGNYISNFSYQGILMQDAINNIFDNNTIEIDTNYVDGHGIEVTQLSSASSNGNNITNTIIRNFNGSGVYVNMNYGPNLFNNLTINSVLPSSTTSGGFVIYNSTNVSLSNSRIYNSGFYGALIRYSSSNNLSNLDIQNSTIYDLYVSVNGTNVTQCNNNISGITSSGGRYINYSNSTVTWSNLNVAELLLCNAPNSVLSNITVRGAGVVRDDGLAIILSNGTVITGSDSSGNWNGFYASRSSNIIIANSTASNNGNTSVYAPILPAGILLDTVTFGDAGSSCGWISYVGIASSNMTLTNDSVANTAGYGIVANAGSSNSGGNMSDIAISNVTVSGSRPFSGSTCYGTAGIYVGSYDNRTIITNSHLFNNSFDIYLFGPGTYAQQVNISGVILDNPLGNMTNYTNISMNDSMTTIGTGLTLSWGNTSAALPANMISFNGKYINVTYALNNKENISSMVWTWTSLELGSMNGSMLSLWRRNSTSWTRMNGSPDTVGDTLSLSNFNATSANPSDTWGLYAILYNTSVPPTPPNVTLFAPDNNTPFYVNSVDFNFSFTDAASTTADCSLYIDGSAEAENATTQNGTLTTLSLSGIADGTHTWNVSCTNQASLTGWSETRNFSITDLPPVVTLVDPPDGNVSNVDNMTFYFTAYDNISSSTTCSLLLDGVANQSGISAPNGTETPVEVDGIPEGAHTWNVSCTNDASNTGYSQTNSFSVMLPSYLCNATLIFPASDTSEPQNGLFNVTAQIGCCGSTYDCQANWATLDPQNATPFVPKALSQSQPKNTSSLLPKNVTPSLPMSPPKQIKVSSFVPMNVTPPLTKKSTQSIKRASGYRISSEPANYSVSDITPANLISAPTDSGSTDDSVVYVGLPFPFTFYDTTYTNVSLVSNGWIGFGTGSYDWLGWENGLPGVYFYDYDLYPDDAGCGQVYYDNTTYTDKAIFEWRDVCEYGNHNSKHSGEIILYANGTIDIINGYNDAVNGSQGVMYDSSTYTQTTPGTNDYRFTRTPPAVLITSTSVAPNPLYVDENATCSAGVIGASSVDFDIIYPDSTDLQLGNGTNSSGTWTSPLFNASQEGSYTCGIVATDSYANISTSSLQFSALNPISLNGWSTDPVTPYRGDMTSCTANVTSPNGISSVNFTVTYPDSSVQELSATRDGDNWTSSKFDASQDGYYYCNLNAADNAGYTYNSSYYDTWTYFYVQSPIYFNNMYLSYSQYYAPSELNCTAVLSDPFAIQSVYFNITYPNGTVVELGNGSTSDGSTWISSNFMTDDNGGYYYCNATAVDEAAHSNNASTYIYIDPSIYIDSWISQSPVYVGSGPQCIVYAYPYSGADVQSVYFNITYPNGSVVELAGTPNWGGYGNNYWVSPAIDDPVAGDYSCNVFAEDDLGFTSNYSIPMSVSNWVTFQWIETVPQNILFPGENDTECAANVNSPNGISEVDFNITYPDSSVEQLGPGTLTADGSTWTSPLFNASEEGAYNCTAAAVDYGSNTNNDSIAFQTSPSPLYIYNYTDGRGNLVYGDSELSDLGYCNNPTLGTGFASCTNLLDPDPQLLAHEGLYAGFPYSGYLESLASYNYGYYNYAFMRFVFNMSDYSPGSAATAAFRWTGYTGTCPSDGNYGDANFGYNIYGLNSSGDYVLLASESDDTTNLTDEEVQIPDFESYIANGSMEIVVEATEPTAYYNCGDSSVEADYAALDLYGIPQVGISRVWTTPDPVGLNDSARCLANATSINTLESVYFNITYPNSSVVELGNGTPSGDIWQSGVFVPDQAGQYTCTVVAQDNDSNTAQRVTTFNAGDKGVVPVGSGTPFYTINDNPTDSDCLADFAAGTYCNTTWTVNATGDGNSAWEFYVIYNATGPSGPYSLQTNQVNITIQPLPDITPPNISLDQPPDGSMLNNGSVGFGFTTTDDTSTMMSCSLFVDTFLNQSDVSASNGTESFFNVSGLAEGPHEWFVECNDSSNNTGTSGTWGFTVDTMPPNVTLLSPPDGTLTNSSNTAFTYTTTDDIATTMSCALLLDGSVNMTNPSVANGTEASFDVSGIADGSHSWHVACNDTANNTGTSETWHFTTQTTPPATTQPSPSRPTPSLNASFSSSCSGNTVTIQSEGNPISDADVSVDGVRVNTTGQNGTVVFGGCGKSVEVYADKSGYLPEDFTAGLISCDACVVTPVTPPITPVQPVCPCMNDSACKDYEYCQVPQNTTCGTCVQVSGQCGQAKNHVFVPYGYQCGPEPGCPSCPGDEICTDHICLTNDLKGPNEAFVGTNASVQAFEGNSSCVDCDLQITDPTGNVLTGKTDAIGYFTIPLTVRGNYTVALLRNGTVVKTILINALPKAPIQPPVKPTAVTTPDYMWLIWLLILAVLIILLIAYYRSRRKKEPMKKFKKKPEKPAEAPEGLPS